MRSKGRNCSVALVGRGNEQLVLSTEMIRHFGHRKGIRELTFRMLTFVGVNPNISSEK